MNKLIFTGVILFSISCSSGEQKTKEKKQDSVNAEATYSIPVNTEYRYEIRNLKTGEIKDLSQDEYLQSDYIDNSDYEVTEHALVK